MLNDSYPQLGLLWKTIDANNCDLYGQALRTATAVTLGSLDIARTLQDWLAIKRFGVYKVVHPNTSPLLHL